MVEKAPKHTNLHIQPKPKGGARPGAGRPTTYSQEMSDTITKLIVDENTNLWRICKRPGMPEYSVVWGWMSRHPEFDLAYRKACAERAHHVAREIEELEDLVLLGVYSPQQASVVTTMKRWRAKMLNPREYGDVQRTEISAPGGGPVEFKDETSNAARIAALVGIAATRKREDDAQQLLH